jgi:hypothetical protein
MDEFGAAPRSGHTGEVWSKDSAGAERGQHVIKFANVWVE